MVCRRGYSPRLQVGSLGLLLVFLALQCQAQTQPTSCSPEDASPCRNNSACNSMQQCECSQFYFSPSGLNDDCRSNSEPDPRCAQYDQECVFCGSEFQGPCMRCREVLMQQSDGGTDCVSNCPSGTTFFITIIPNTTISARVCEGEQGNGNALPQWAIILIAVMCALLVVIVLVVGVVFAVIALSRTTQGQLEIEQHAKAGTESAADTLRTKRSSSFSFEKKQQQQQRQEGQFAGQRNLQFDEIDGDEETQFMKKLDYLKSHSEVYLRMLNDMRRRLKELPANSPTSQQYRNVMRDVTRLLYLLNKKPENVEMPLDGLQLLNWSEQILERYIASQGGGGPTKKPQTTYRLSAIGPQDETHF